MHSKGLCFLHPRSRSFCGITGVSALDRNIFLLENHRAISERWVGAERKTGEKGEEEEAQVKSLFAPDGGGGFGGDVTPFRPLPPLLSELMGFSCQKPISFLQKLL